VKAVYPSVVVFISGAAVLAIELLGTRVLGPFYGVSLFLWSALITVTLLALSVGYALGGRLADKGPTPRRLGWMLLGAGAWLLLLPLLRDRVLHVAEPFGLRFAVLVAALLLFAPPLALLGMVSPYAIRLRATSLGEVGRTAGNLYALSTVGSVLAALATGFFLIPYFGVLRLTALTGLLLVMVGLLGLLGVRGRGSALAALLLIVPAALVGLRAAQDGAEPSRGLLSLEPSAYAELRVVERDDLRCLLIDGGTHTIVDAETLESRFPYVHVLDLLDNVRDRPGKLLLVGLGGGSVAKLFARQGWSVDAVEIDPAVTAIARRDFGLSPADARVFDDDGRHHLASVAVTYDAVVIDAFGSSAVPFHMVTREAFALAASRLAPDGVLALNLEAVGWDDLLVRAVAATLREALPEVLELPIAEPPDQLGNVVLFASRRKLELAREIPPTMDRFSDVYAKNHAWDNRFVPEMAGAPVLTDDKSPVDLWSERINRAARAELHSSFLAGVGW
jgi:spermidine synthase